MATETVNLRPVAADGRVMKDGLCGLTVLNPAALIVDEDGLTSSAAGF